MNIMFCVNSNFLKSPVLNPNTLRVAISRSISVNDKIPRLYNTTIAKSIAKNIKIETIIIIDPDISSQFSFISLNVVTLLIESYSLSTFWEVIMLVGVKFNPNSSNLSDDNMIPWDNGSPWILVILHSTQSSDPMTCHFIVSPTPTFRLSAIFAESDISVLDKLSGFLFLSVWDIKFVSFNIRSDAVFSFPWAFISIACSIIVCPFTSFLTSSISLNDAPLLIINLDSKWEISSYSQVFKLSIESFIPKAETKRATQPITPTIAINALNLFLLASL